MDKFRVKILEMEIYRHCIYDEGKAAKGEKRPQSHFPVGSREETECLSLDLRPMSLSCVTVSMSKTENTPRNHEELGSTTSYVAVHLT